jgi:glycosyltransferase involved in cell wall biosynthesis
MPSNSPQPKKQPQPLIDILLPVRNGAPFLAQAIESIQAQTEQSWRLLILDDGSTDQSPKIAKNFAAKDHRIRLIRYPARGLIATLNAGLKLCRAPFVARQDADDISFPERLAVEIDYLRRNRECIAVSSGGITIDDKGRKTGGAWLHKPELADASWIPAREPYLSHPFLMVRREIYQRLGYRNFFVSEDADLCWRLEETGKIRSLPIPLGYYRAFENSASTRMAVNTRIQAVASQLAAIAARRRRAQRGDLHLDPRLYVRMVKANDLEAIIEIFRDRLTDEEFQYLRRASIIKLLEITTYRPSRVNLREARLAYRELYAIARSRWSRRDSIFHTCSHACRVLRRRGQHEVARELAPGFMGWLIVAMKQHWLLPFLPPPAGKARLPTRPLSALQVRSALIPLLAYPTGML